MYKDKIESLKRQKAKMIATNDSRPIVQRRMVNLDGWITYFEHKQKQWERAVKR